MKFLITVVTIAVLSGIAEQFAPWWSVAVVAFIVSLFLVQRPGKSFLAGFCGVALCWLSIALFLDVANEHILSSRMAGLFHLPGYGSFMAVTVCLGGLVGGLAAWAAALIKKPG